jgi:GNAT superfamily N-acetyltransferase
MDAITITPATSDDASGIEEVRYQAWLITYPNSEHHITVKDIEYRFRNRHSIEETKTRQERLAHPRPGEHWLVAKEGVLAVGFCLIINNAEKNELGALFVSPAYQGKGIGTALWQEGRKYLDSHRDIDVWTPVYNVNAIGFYRKLGFKETGKRHSDPWLTMKNGIIIPELQLVLKDLQPRVGGSKRPDSSATME